MRFARWLVPTALALALPATALAGDDLMRVNEISPSEDWVELLDVAPQPAPYFMPEYVVRSYDGAANELASVTYPQPVPFEGLTTPFLLSIALPAGAGQVCFERQRGGGFPEDYRQHCMGYGAVTTPAMHRLVNSGPRPIKMPVAPLPGPGESTQRQRCGRAVSAPATKGAENVDVPSACAGLRISCDDPRHGDYTTPRMNVIVPRELDIDRPLVVKVRMNEVGSISTRGAFFGGHTHFMYGPIVRRLPKSATVRIRVPMSRNGKRALKRELGSGELVRASVVSVGKDNACYPNRYHSSRIVTLVP